MIRTSERAGGGEEEPMACTPSAPPRVYIGAMSEGAVVVLGSNK